MPQLLLLLPTLRTAHGNTHQQEHLLLMQAAAAAGVPSHFSSWTPVLCSTACFNLLPSQLLTLLIKAEMHQVQVLGSAVTLGHHLLPVLL
jgi:hypothetical protein